MMRFLAVIFLITAVLAGGCATSPATVLALEQSLIQSQRTTLRYELYRARAVQDSLPGVVNLLDAVLAGEAVQRAQLQARLAGLSGPRHSAEQPAGGDIRVVNTLMNLYTARSGAELAAHSHYPQAAIEAQQEDNDAIATDFLRHSAARLTHSRILATAIESLELCGADSLMPACIALCGDCGALQQWGGVDSGCQVCGAEAYTLLRFERVESPLLWSLRHSRSQ